MATASVWRRPVVTDVPRFALSEIMSEQLAVRLEQDDVDEDMKLALRLSMLDAESVPAGDATACAAMVAHAGAALADASEAAGEQSNTTDADTAADADLALALRLHLEENGHLEGTVGSSQLQRESAVEDADDACGDDLVVPYHKRGNRVLPAYRNPSTAAPSKHDAAMCGQRNAYKLERQFGDAVGVLPRGQVIGNAQYSAMKSFLLRRPRGTRGCKRDSGDAVDGGVTFALAKLGREVPTLQLKGALRLGADSCVYKAQGWPGTNAVAVKAYRTSLDVFDVRVEMLGSRHRFESQKYTSQSSRKVMKLWADKEMRILRTLQEAGVASVTPVMSNGHVLVTALLADDDGVVSPNVAEARLTAEEALDAYVQIAVAMRRMWQLGLVHGDLSPSNVVYHNQRCYIASVAQALPAEHRDAIALLHADADTIASHFSDLGCPVLPHNELVALVTEVSPEDAVVPASTAAAAVVADEARADDWVAGVSDSDDDVDVAVDVDVAGTGHDASGASERRSIWDWSELSDDDDADAVAGPVDGPAAVIFDDDWRAHPFAVRLMEVLRE